MKVKFYEDARCSAKENPTPCKVPTVIEVEKVSFDDDTNLVIFWDKDFCQYESVIPENDHYAQDRILSQLLERGYADLTIYGAFVYMDGEELPDYEGDENDEDEDDE